MNPDITTPVGAGQLLFGVSFTLAQTVHGLRKDLKLDPYTIPPQVIKPVVTTISQKLIAIREACIKPSLHESNRDVIALEASLKQLSSEGSTLVHIDNAIKNTSDVLQKIRIVESLLWPVHPQHSQVVLKYMTLFYSTLDNPRRGVRMAELEDLILSNGFDLDQLVLTATVGQRCTYVSLRDHARIFGNQDMTTLFDSVDQHRHAN